MNEQCLNMETVRRVGQLGLPLNFLTTIMISQRSAQDTVVKNILAYFSTIDD